MIFFLFLPTPKNFRLVRGRGGKSGEALVKNLRNFHLSSIGIVINKVINLVWCWDFYFYLQIFFIAIPWQKLVSNYFNNIIEKRFSNGITLRFFYFLALQKRYRKKSGGEDEIKKNIMIYYFFNNRSNIPPVFMKSFSRCCFQFHRHKKERKCEKKS